MTLPTASDVSLTNDSTIDISLFLVNHQISHEARDAFFDVNTARLMVNPDESSNMERLRNVEVADFLAHTVLTDSNWLAQSSTIRRYVALPRLRSLTVICHALLDPERSFRQFLESGLGQIDLECTALGTFELKLPFKTAAKVYFQHDSLVSVLPKARTLTSTNTLECLEDQDNRGYDNAGQVFDESGTRLDRPIDLGLAVWLKRFEIMRLHRAGNSITTLTEEEVETAEEYWADFAEGHWAGPFADPTVADDLPAGVPLTDLTLADHGSKLLEWGTEALNFVVADAAGQYKEYVYEFL